MFSFLFEEDINKILNKYKIDKLGDYSLDKKNIKEFIKESDDDVKGIVKKIIKNTKYVDFKEFMRNLYKSVKDLVKKLKEKKKGLFYVYKTKDFNNKSNKWIYKYIKIMIKHLEPNIKIILIDDKYKKIKTDDFIILPDDCIYSGSQIRNNIKDVIKIFKKFINIYILCPYISSQGISRILYKDSEIPYDYNIFVSNHININKYVINNFINTEEIKIISSYYGNLQMKDVINDDDDIYYTDFSGVYLIYFNHKLADYASTISLFYIGVVPNKYNKKIFEKRVKTGNKGKLNFQVIPLISNCIYNKSNINVNSPICPPPPYKRI